MEALTDQLNELYRRYRYERGADTLSASEFERVLLMYPAILVLGADGHIDTTEMMFISQLSRYMSDRAVNISEADLRAEIRYLSRNAPYWRDSFINVLRPYVQQHGLGVEVLDLMISAAGSSTGNMRQNILIKMQSATAKATGSNTPDETEAFVSEEEKEAILNLVSELGIGSDEVVIGRLQALLG